VIGGGPREQEGTEAAHELLAGQLPTAVVDYNDSCAIGLINTLQKSAIRVPGRYLRRGYDDSHTAKLSYVELTTVSQNAARMAEIAVRWVVARLNEQLADEREVVLSPQLIQRATAAAPRSNRYRCRCSPLRQADALHRRRPSPRGPPPRGQQHVSVSLGIGLDAPQARRRHRGGRSRESGGAGDSGRAEDDGNRGCRSTDANLVSQHPGEGMFSRVERRRALSNYVIQCKDPIT
jgi:hypothetical protein